MLKRKKNKTQIKLVDVLLANSTVFNRKGWALLFDLTEPVDVYTNGLRHWANDLTFPIELFGVHSLAKGDCTLPTNWVHAVMQWRSMIWSDRFD